MSSAGLFSIRFRPVRERHGRCWRKTVSADQPTAAARCAANMVRCAIATRDSTLWGGHPAQRLMMREQALWARVFAQQIPQDDPRFAEIDRRKRPLFQVMREAVA